MHIIKYETEEEAQTIIAEKQAEGLVLVAVSNITEGNFLGFDDTVPVEPTPLSDQVALMQAAIDDLILNGGV